ncbi:MAG: UDP-N-acetylmuramate dehydrogenase, partial [Fulvivirga sp.]|nr:UDP-N-acetylmuramate dehydrogenase [Fulvivirga sp.]
NIGAYGVEIKEVFEELTAVNRKTGQIEVFDRKACRFGYRESVFKNVYKDQYVIGQVTFKLTTKNHKLNTSYGAIGNTLETMGIKNPTIRDISNAVISIRQSKLPDPAKIGNAGSFFKNPSISRTLFEQLKQNYNDIPGYELPDNQVKVPAAWLIEKCGWKGYVKDNIGVHKNQALVLVNYGKGQGHDIKELAMKIQGSVNEKFGIQLKPEVNII